MKNHTMPNDGFSDPYIICCFIDSDRLFVALFENQTFNHKHFVYDIKQNKIEGKVVDFVIPDTSEENFPVDCFYDALIHKVDVFYR